MALEDPLTDHPSEQAAHDDPAPPGEVLWADGPPPPQPTWPASPALSHTADTPTDPFAERAMLRPRQPQPPSGLRRLVARLTGRDRAGEDQAWEEALERCRRPVPGGRRIAVISRKGGVGKTTTTLMLGHTLAAARQDRVLAIDGNPDAGTLGHRVQRQTTATVLDAVEGADSLAGYPDARRLTSQAHSRLEVLASPEDPHASRALRGVDYQRVMDVMGRHYTLLLCDTGTGILDDANLGILDEVDQIVVVSGVALDTARTAAKTLDWLDANGRSDLVRDAVVVINAVAELGRVDLGQVTNHFVDRSRVVHHVGYDRQLEAGAITDPDTLDRRTQAAWLGVAASVADGFELPSPRDLPGPGGTGSAVAAPPHPSDDATDPELQP